MSKNIFARQTFATFLTQVLTFVISAVIGIVITRILGPERNGQYFLVVSLVTLVVVGVKCSIEVGGTYLVGRKSQPISEVLAHYLFSTVGLTLLAYGLLALFWVPLKHYLFPGLQNNLALFGLLAVPFNLLLLYLPSIFLLQQNVRSYNLVFIIQNLVTAGLLAIFIAGLKLGVLGAIMAWVGGMMLAAIWITIQLVREHKPRLAVKPPLLRELFSFGLKTHLGETVDYLINRSDTFFVNYFLGEASVGYYSVALSAELLWYIPNSVIAILYPRLSANADNSLSIAQRVCRITVFITYLPAFAVMAAAHWLVPVFYGQAFAPAIIPLIIVLPGIASLSISKTLKTFLYSEGKPQYGAIASFIAYGVDIVLNLLLIPRYHLAGAAMAVCISYILYAGLILAIFLWQYPGVGLLKTIFITKSDFTELRQLVFRPKLK
jgi:O-antigen/teichoic acid export membrane protein